MNADAEFDAALRWQAGVALDHAVLHFDGAAHRIDDAAKLHEGSVAGALHHASSVHRDGGVDEIAAERPESRERPIFVRPSQPAVSDDIGGQDRRKFADLAHLAPSFTTRHSTDSTARPLHLERRDFAATEGARSPIGRTAALGPKRDIVGDCQEGLEMARPTRCD